MLKKQKPCAFTAFTILYSASSKTSEKFNLHFDRCFKILYEPSFKFILKWIDPKELRPGPWMRANMYYINIHRQGWVWIFFFLFFLGPHLQHIEVPRLGVELEQQMPAFLSHSNTRFEPHLWLTPQLRQCWILNSLSKARDWTHILMDTMLGS